MGKSYAYSTKEKPSVHDKFTDEMCKKTVINRACKNFVCTSDDSDLLIETMNRTGEYNEEDIIQTTHQEVKEEIKQEANQGEIIDIPVEEAENIETETVIESQASMLDEDQPF
jgi:recombination protein RecT